MGIRIQATGEAVYVVGKMAFRISASSLKQGEKIQNAPPLLKGGSEDLLTSFSAVTTFGLFTWRVSYSVDESGACIDDVELVSSPAGVEVTKDVDFDVIDE